MSEKSEWLKRPEKTALAAKLKVVAWVVSAVVLLLVGVMQRLRLELPAGWDTSMLPGFHALVNALGAVVLVVGVVCVKRGKIRLHRAAMTAAMGLSALFLLSYVAYHLTNDPTRYPEGEPLRPLYLGLLLTHVVAAAVSFPFILFTYVAGLTNRFAAHRRLARWVFPLWLYVAVTGPAVYWMIRPFY